MKSTTIIPALIISAFLFTTACNTPGQNASADLGTKQDSISYSFGYLQGSQLANEGITDLDMNNFIAGLETGLSEQGSEINDAEMRTIIQAYLQQKQVEQMQQMEAESEVNREEANQFLEENAENEDITVTDSGLQYRVLEEGSGESPGPEDEVEVHYRGTLLDGEEFDSSYSRNETATFPLNRVIPGWTEGLQLMTEGSKYEFFIPSDLAYGSNPPPGSIIPPGAVLVFEVELIDIKE
ncbi:MAG: FKBP-type peptidyl-prolyl cis-trans isomerase [Balneolaceae bacterium]